MEEQRDELLRELNTIKKTEEESKEKLNVISHAHAQLKQSYNKLCEESKKKMAVTDHERRINELTSDRDKRLNKLTTENTNLRSKLLKVQAERDRLSVGIKGKDYEGNDENRCQGRKHSGNFEDKMIRKHSGNFEDKIIRKHSGNFEDKIMRKDYGDFLKEVHQSDNIIDKPGTRHQWRNMRANEMNQLVELKRMLKRKEAFVDQLHNYHVI